LTSRVDDAALVQVAQDVRSWPRNDARFGFVVPMRLEKGLAVDQLWTR